MIKKHMGCFDQALQAGHSAIQESTCFTIGQPFRIISQIVPMRVAFASLHQDLVGRGQRDGDLNFTTHDGLWLDVKILNYLKICINLLIINANYILFL